MKIREQFIKGALDSCRHFNGVQNKRCRAGVQYEQPSSAGLEPALDVTMPCIPSFVNGRQTWTCALFKIMSREDAEKEADDRIVKLDRTVKARHAAKDDSKAKGFSKGHGGRGSIPCPSCEGGTLRYSVAACNGHMHGCCSTQGCVKWME